MALTLTSLPVRLKAIWNFYFGRRIVNITNGAGGKALITTEHPHGKSTGNTVSITGNSVSGYNTSSAITVVNSTSFSLDSVSYTSTGTGGSWT